MGLDTGTTQLRHRVLGGLGLVLARRCDVGHQRHVHVADISVAGIKPELSDGLEKREDLNIADRAADLGDDHVNRFTGEHPDTTLNLVGDVWNDLHRAAQILAPALGCNNRGVDGPGGGIGVTCQVLVDEAFVVTQVQVGLAAIIGHENLAVLERVQRAGINVDVRIQLLDNYAEPTLFEETPEGGSG